MSPLEQRAKIIEAILTSWQQLAADETIAEELRDDFERNYELAWSMLVDAYREMDEDRQSFARRDVFTGGLSCPDYDELDSSLTAFGKAMFKMIFGLGWLDYAKDGCVGLIQPQMVKAAVFGYEAFHALSDEPTGTCFFGDAQLSKMLEGSEWGEGIFHDDFHLTNRAICKEIADEVMKVSEVKRKNSDPRYRRFASGPAVKPPLRKFADPLPDDREQ